MVGRGRGEGPGELLGAGEQAAPCRAGGDGAGVHQSHGGHLSLAGLAALPVGEVPGGVADGQAVVVGGVPRAEAGAAEGGLHHGAGGHQIRQGAVLHQLHVHGDGGGVHVQGELPGADGLAPQHIGRLGNAGEGAAGAASDDALHYIEAVAPDSVEMKTAELLSGIDGTMMFRYNSKDTFQTLYVYLSEYQSGKRISHKKVLELSYEDVKSAKNGLIVITPDFDNFTAKLIAADEYSKYMTEMPILEGVANREYYGRSATSIENKSPIEYGTEQGLAALIYGEQGVSSLPIQDIKGEYIDTENEYMYYYSVEFVK